MRLFGRGAIAILLTLAACARGGEAVKAPPPDTIDTKLQANLSAIAAESDGRIAVSVLHLRTGARASVHGDARLPMMSVFKLPLAVATLGAIDEGRWKMDTKIAVKESEIRPEVSPIAAAWAKGEKSPTLETMLRLVIQQSDNTAGDKLVTLNGGGAKITERLRKLGIAGIDVAEQEIDIFARIHCAGAHVPAGGWTAARVGDCHEASQEAQQAAARHEVEAAPNGATTDAIVDLLGRLEHGTILSATSRKWLLMTLAGTATGPRRLKGMLPDGTPVAHKTGTGDTIGGMNIATNDVGIVTLPNGDRFAIAVFIGGSHAADSTLEALIAKLARAAWDVFRG